MVFSSWDIYTQYSCISVNPLQWSWINYEILLKAKQNVDCQKKKNASDMPWHAFIVAVYGESVLRHQIQRQHETWAYNHKQESSNCNYATCWPMSMLLCHWHTFIVLILTCTAVLSLCILKMHTYLKLVLYLLVPKPNHYWFFQNINKNEEIDDLISNDQRINLHCRLSVYERITEHSIQPTWCYYN